MGKIADIEAQIETLVGQITQLKKVYDYPIVELGRELPALVILYDGIAQGWGPNKSTENEYAFEFVLYYQAEGRKLKTVWDELKDDTNRILDKLRANPGLGGTCWQARIESGEPVVEIPASAEASPRWIGHRFRLIAQVEET